MHTYDAFSRVPHQTSIPPMRSPHDPVAGSCTPIYDALYSEYRRLFRALPGDRSGEEHFQYRPVQTVHSWPPLQDSRPPTTVHGNGRHRDRSPAALPPGPSATGIMHDNRLRGL